jgi:hypothetical protein
MHSTHQLERIDIRLSVPDDGEIGHRLLTAMVGLVVDVVDVDGDVATVMLTAPGRNDDNGALTITGVPVDDNGNPIAGARRWWLQLDCVDAIEVL